MDYTYTKHQLLRMERKVLCGLKFDLSYCPPLHFLILLASVARCSAKVYCAFFVQFLVISFQNFNRSILAEVIFQYVRSEVSCVPPGGVDGSLSPGAVSPGGPVCSVSARAAGWSSPLLVAASSAGAPDTRRGGCLVSGLQHPCRQVCIVTSKMHSF